MRLFLKADLDRAGCEIPNCGHDHSRIFLSCRVHVRCGADVCYDKTLGHLIATCCVCGQEIARIAPAERIEMKRPFFVDIVDRYKPGDPRPDGYIDWDEWTDVQLKGGLRQRKCPGCGLWRFPQERCCEGG